MKRTVAILLLIMLIITATACSKDNGGGGEVLVPQKTNLTVALHSEPFGLVPQLTNDGYSAVVMFQVYSTLLAKTDDGRLVGDLAKNWQISNDELSIVFNLREDVTFHNGKKLTAEDVKFSFELGMGSPQVADVFGSLESVEVLGEYSVRVNLKFRYAPLLEKLSFPQSAGIVNKSTFEEVGSEAYGENPVGSGPYKLRSWDKGVRIVLEANEGYYQGAASIKEVTMRFIPDPTTATIALQTGEVDITSNVSFIDLPSLDSSKVTVYEGPSTHFNWVAINTSKEPFNNAVVRRAMDHAIDKKSVIIAAMEGHATLAETIAFEGIMGYDKSIGGNDYDPAKARELLASAGYAAGFETTMLALGGYTSTVAEVIQDNLAQVGIMVEIQNLEPSAFMQEILGGSYKISFLASDSGTYDPEQIYQRLHSSGAYSVSFYNNPELNTVLERIIQETDEAVRRAAVAQVQVMFKEQVPLIPLFWSNRVVVANSKLANAQTAIRRLEVYKLSWTN